MFSQPNYTQSISPLITLLQILTQIKLLYFLTQEALYNALMGVPSHIGVPGNERVDGVARAASNSAEKPVELPRSDMKSYIKRYTTEQWSLSWRSMDPLSNKYRSVSKSIRPFDDANCPNRLWSVILCRLRLGHTQLTHGYLLSHDPLPHCMDCIVPLSVSHFIIECHSYSDERRNCFGLGPHALDRILSPPTTALNGPLHRFLLQTELYPLL